MKKVCVQLSINFRSFSKYTAPTLPQEHPVACPITYHIDICHGVDSELLAVAQVCKLSYGTNHTPPFVGRGP